MRFDQTRLPGFVPSGDRGVDGELVACCEMEESRAPARRRARASDRVRPGAKDRRDHGAGLRAPLGGGPCEGGLRVEARPPHREQHELRIAAVERRGLRTPRPAPERRSGPGSSSSAPSSVTRRSGIVAAQDLRHARTDLFGRGRHGERSALTAIAAQCDEGDCEAERTPERERRQRSCADIAAGCYWAKGSVQGMPSGGKNTTRFGKWFSQRGERRKGTGKKNRFFKHLRDRNSLAAGMFLARTFGGVPDRRPASIGA